jgi:hypothetical protein
MPLTCLHGLFDKWTAFQLWAIVRKAALESCSCGFVAWLGFTNFRRCMLFTTLCGLCPLDDRIMWASFCNKAFIGQLSGGGSSAKLVHAVKKFMWAPSNGRFNHVGSYFNKLIMWAPFSNGVFGIAGARRSIQLLRSSSDDVGSFLLQRNHVGSLLWAR